MRVAQSDFFAQDESFLGGNPANGAPHLANCIRVTKYAHLQTTSELFLLPTQAGEGGWSIGGPGGGLCFCKNTPEGECVS